MSKIWRLIALVLASLFCLSATPAVDQIGLYKDDNGSTSNPGTKLTGGDPMTLAFRTVTTPDPFSTLDLITITFWNTNEATLNSPDSQFHATYHYYCDTQDWSLLAGAASWELNKSYSTWFTNSSTNRLQSFRLVFTPGKTVPAATLPVWKMNIKLVNDSAEMTNVQSSYPFSAYSGSSTGQAGGGTLFGAPNPVNIGIAGQKIQFLYSKVWGSDCTVDLQIYTIYGELVKNVAMGKPYLSDETLNLDWDGNNGSGKQVASGIYTAIMNVKYATSQKERLVFNFAVYK